MKRLLSVACVLILLPAVIHATAQAPDVLLYKGKKYALYANPLESFYKNQDDRPKFFVGPNTMSSGNWRGYIATWSIEDGSLYLVGIDSWICGSMVSRNCRKATLKNLFGRKFRAGKVKADWFTGELRVPDGKMLQYVHMGYGSVYEREIILQVESGRVVGESVIDNTKRVIPSEIELQRQELEKMRPKPEE